MEKEARVHESSDLNSHEHVHHTDLDAHREHQAGKIEIDEAAEIYGDLATAEEYGYVSRG